MHTLRTIHGEEQPSQQPNEHHPALSNDQEPLLPPAAASQQQASAELLPADKFYISLLLFTLLGVGSLLPWNFFTTARSYFEYKLRNVSNITGWPDQPWMRDTFESYLAVFSNLPGVLCVLANAAAAGRVTIAGRMVVSLSLMSAMFACSAAFVLVDTDWHQSEFFWATLASVALMSGSGAVMQGSLFGLAAMFPKRYINAVTLGQASGGVIAAVAYIISLEIGSHPRSAAFLYFLSATVVLLMCLAAYLLLRRLSFAPNRRRLSNRPAWRHLIGPGGGAFAVLTITLTLYPALLSSLSPMAEPWLLYSPLCCFLVYNTFDLFGRFLTAAAPTPGACGRANFSLITLALLRLLFVPLFLMCNYSLGGEQRRLMPVYFAWDWTPPLLVSAFGLSNGYLFTLCFMRASEQAPTHLAESHGAVMSMCAVVGSSTGSALSFLFTAGTR
uniref:Equilibrative nucleoside transporter 3 n=1 Tax=Macrostomum lignano TaxID=282301 RepID=A0A1I8JME0_9PLAT